MYPIFSDNCGVTGVVDLITLTIKGRVHMPVCIYSFNHLSLSSFFKYDKIDVFIFIIKRDSEKKKKRCQ